MVFHKMYILILLFLKFSLYYSQQIIENNVTLKYFLNMDDLNQIFRLENITYGDNSTFYEREDYVVIQITGYDSKMNEYLRSKEKDPVRINFKDNNVEGFIRMYKCVEDTVKLLSIGQKVRIWCPYNYAMREMPVASTIGPFSNLIFDIELLDIINKKSISKKKIIVENLKVFNTEEEVNKFFKVETLKEGDNKTFPSLGDRLTYHFIGRLYKNKRIFARSDTTIPPLSYFWGVDTEGILLCHTYVLKFMSKGQRVKFVCPYKYAYNDYSPNRLIKPKSNLEFEFELVDIIPPLYDHNKRLNTKEDMEDVFQIKYLKEGDGKTFPEFGDYIHYHYSLFLKTSEGNLVLKETSNGITPLKFTYELNAIIQCQSQFFRYLSLGTKIFMFCPYKYAYGDQKKNDYILPYTDLYFEIELITIIKPTKKNEL